MNHEEFQQCLTKQPSRNEESTVDARPAAGATGVAWAFIIVEVALAVLAVYVLLGKFRVTADQDTFTTNHEGVFHRILQ